MSHTSTILHAPIAQPTGQEVVPILTVVFDQEIALQADRAWYAEQADTLVEVLEHHCPGGFVDALLASLCARQASILRVRVVAGGR